MLWCTALFGLMAQQPEFRVDVDVVNLLATVRDASGRVASGLTKDDFILEENGRPQQIRYFASQSELPMTIGLLIDTSFSQRRILESQRSAAREFFGNVLRPEQDRAFVVSFDYEVQTIQGMTASGDVLSAALDRLSTPPSQVEYSRHKTGKRRPTAGTKIYDALVMACDGKLRPVAGRKAVLLISDGVDMGSAKTLADAIRAAQVADAVVYAIRYYDPAAYRPLGGGGEAAPAERGAEKLRRIAAETGGRMLEAAGAAELHRIFRQVEEELRNQYSIGYKPEGGGGGYRAIRLRTRQQGLEVQTRAGYYR
jgi:VWFA-related protein